ncbi:DUF2690 domain-containing protein [Streptomyces sp. LMG1-1-1.1]|uniref:DUF2690 domain-containing protein n=1 Tax=Streptomyces sp. LMG1-1-1.1 TaxID=3135245 RepID=UPI0034673EF7
MRSTTRKFATLGGAVALAASGLVGVASPASAATSCYATSCNGLDPSTTICQNDARTVSTGSTGIELRYSPTCRAAWARKQNNGSHTSYITVVNTNYDQYLATVSPWGGGWTRMVNDAGITARAAETQDGGDASMTGWY